MASPTVGWFLTHHAIDRLYERHPGIFADPHAYGPKRMEAAQRVLFDAIEDKAIKNNTDFMVFVHEKYGYDDVKIFVNGDVIFLGKVVDGKRKVIITTLVRSTAAAAHIRNAGQTREDRFKPKQRRMMAEKHRHYRNNAAD